MTNVTGLKLTDRNDREPPNNAYGVDEPSDGNPPPNADVVLSLAGVSKMFRISRFQLLCFEALGLIRRRYRVGAQRVYGWADCERIALVIKSRHAGVALRDIAPVVRAANNGVRTVERRRGLARCVALIDRLEKRRRLLDDALNELQQVCTLLATEASDSASR